MPYVLIVAHFACALAAVAYSLAAVASSLAAVASSLVAVASSLASFALPTAVPAAAPTGAQVQRLALRLEPSAHYSVTVHMTHVIANDLRGVLKKLAGSKADPVTILEERAADVAIGGNGAIDATTVDVRHYGGLQAKDKSSMRRTGEYKGLMAADGKRSPSDEPLVDAGEGALSELPDTPVSAGQSWTFTRRILIDRDLGQGTMTYTDTLQRFETRDNHRVAIIAVKGAGRADVAPDLRSKGFQTADMTFAGTAEFDETAGLPGVQHYTAHVQWNTKVMWVHLGLVFDDTYDATPWSLKGR